MRLEIRFPDSGIGTPVLIFRNGEKICRYQHARWVQLFALMIYRNLNGMAHGNVTLEDIKKLIAFHGISSQSSTKWLLNTARSLPPMMQAFMQSYTIIKRGGPFRIFIQQDQVLVDYKLLEEYLRLIYTSSERLISSQDSPLVLEIKAANLALGSFEMETSQLLYDACIRMFDSEPNCRAIYKPLIYDRLAFMEKHLNGATHRLKYLHLCSQHSARELKDPDERNLAMSYMLVNKLYRTPVTDSNLRRVLYLSRKAADIANNLPHKNGDRACILARNHAFRAGMIVRFGLNESVIEQFDSIKRLNEFIADGHAPKFMPSSSPRTLATLSLSNDLYRLSRAGALVSDNELTQYYEFLSDKALKGWTTLTFAVRIGRNYNRCGHFEEAYTFLTEALLQHSCMHQSLTSRRAMATRQELLAKLDGVGRKVVI